MEKCVQYKLQAGNKTSFYVCFDFGFRTFLCGITNHKRAERGFRRRMQTCSAGRAVNRAAVLMKTSVARERNANRLLQN